MLSDTRLLIAAVAAVFYVRDLGGHHCPLALAEMPAMQVL
jgi:hypothetical protein